MEAAMTKTLEAMSDNLGDVPAGTTTIFVVSDSTGETAKLLISRLLVQFEDAYPMVQIFGYVSSPERLAEVLRQASNQGNVLVFATLVDPTMVGWLKKLGPENSVPIVDVMTPLLYQLSSFLESDAEGVPGSGVSHQRIDGLVSKEFFGMVEATQFVHETSFGLNRVDWSLADMALVGITKVGKTGIAVSLAQRGVKAGCVSITADKPFPSELRDVKKVIVLTMQEDELLLRRENHVMELKRKNMSMIANAAMADLDLIRQEQEVVDRALQANRGWIGPIDCTHKDEGEIASEIIRLTRKADKENLASSSSSSASLLTLALVPALAAAAAFVAMHALPARRAVRPTGCGPQPPLLAGSSLAAGLGRGGRAPALPAVVRPVGLDRRLEMEQEMRQQVQDEVMAEDPDRVATQEKTIYVLSDSSGQTAQLLISRLLVQYRSLKPVVRMRANVRTAEQLETIVDEVSAVGPNVMIFATLVDPVLVDKFQEMADRMRVKHIDVMGPLLGSISDFFGATASRVPGGAIPDKGEIVNIELFNRVEAVKYAQQHLLGLNRKDWKSADVLIIGLSRVGKVSLAFYLAQYGVKAACVDIRPDSSLHSELFDLDPSKVVVVQMQVNLLARRRRSRVQEMRERSMPQLFDPGYTDLGRIQREVDFLTNLVKRNPGWLGPLDMTHHAIEERASLIMHAMREARLRKA